MDLNRDPQVRVGPAGWSYEDWKGIVYPPAMPRSQHPLELLCRCFDTIEINATFYRPANPRHAASWVAKVAENPRFTFTAKLWERFTHDRKEWPEEVAVQEYRDGIAPLVEAGKLGAVLVQFPWSFKRSPESRQWLARLVEVFADYPLSIEFRHDSWHCDKVLEGLQARKVAFCNIDQPLFGHSIAPSAEVTAALGYVRFHGRNKAHWFRQESGRNQRYDYLYSEDELKPWIEKIQQMKRKVNDLFIITNNHYRGQAVVNAIEIQAALGYAKYAPPDHLIDAYPQLRRLFRDPVSET